MASAWGDSWGAAWGDSWGALTVVVEPKLDLGGAPSLFDEDRRRKLRDEKDLIDILLAVADRDIL